MSRRKCRDFRHVNGIIVVDKAKGESSNEVLQRVKKIFNASKAGHSGSLDPLATGVLPICFGEATKFCRFLLESNKSYRTLVQLGKKTTTGDAEGDIVEERDVRVTLSDIEAVLERFRGDVNQIPSMYSALKHNGQPLYKLARKGIEVERATRTVSIYRNEIVSFSSTKFVLEVECSKGTYIRTLVEDIGDTLGCLAYVAELRRLKAGPYDEKQSFSFDELESIKKIGGSNVLSSDQQSTLSELLDRINEAGRASLDSDELEKLKMLMAIQRRGENSALDKLLLSVDTSVNDLPRVSLDVHTTNNIIQGKAVQVNNIPSSGYLRIYGVVNSSKEETFFLGVGKVNDDGLVVPVRLVRVSAK